MRVWFEPTSYIIDESSGTVNLIVWTNVPGGPPLGEVEFYTLDETATCKRTQIYFAGVELTLIISFKASVDFRELLGFPVIFTEDSFVTSAAVAIYEDSILEHDEVFIAKLRHVGVETISIVEDEARVTITDNDGKYNSSAAIYGVLMFIPSFYSCRSWFCSIDIHNQ